MSVLCGYHLLARAHLLSLSSPLPSVLIVRADCLSAQMLSRTEGIVPALENIACYLLWSGEGALDAL